MSADFLPAVELPAALHLSGEQTAAILAYLGGRRGPPNDASLTALVAGYVRRVPWESASRIARKNAAGGAAIAARPPAAFWADALTHGSGGTCFESNLAFYALLRTLGFDGYLTINDMHESVGCHTAIIVKLNDQSFLTDVGIPLHRPLPLTPDKITRARSAFHTYVAQPDEPRRYIIERTRHPNRYIFTLVDRPVALDVYSAISSADYGEAGLFLDKVIANKLVEGKLSRFSSGERPYHIKRFGLGNDYEEISLPTHALAAALSTHFAIKEAIIAAALQAVGAA